MPRHTRSSSSSALRGAGSLLVGGLGTVVVPAGLQLGGVPGGGVFVLLNQSPTQLQPSRNNRTQPRSHSVAGAGVRPPRVIGPDAIGLLSDQKLRCLEAAKFITQKPDDIWFKKPDSAAVCTGFSPNLPCKCREVRARNHLHEEDKFRCAYEILSKVIVVHGGGQKSVWDLICESATFEDPEVVESVVKPLRVVLGQRRAVSRFYAKLAKLSGEATEGVTSHEPPVPTVVPPPADSPRREAWADMSISSASRSLF